MSLIIGSVGEIVLFVVYLINSSVFEGAVQDFFGIFNINSHLTDFVNGIFDLTGIVYFLSVVAVFLFLSMQSLIKRRWS